MKKRIHKIIFYPLALILLGVISLGFIPSMVEENIDNMKYIDISTDALDHSSKSYLPADTKAFTFLEGSKKSSDTLGYTSNVVQLEDQDTVTYEVVAEKDATYNIALDTYAYEKDNLVPILNIKINDLDHIANENDTINFQKYFIYESKEVDIGSDKEQSINAVYIPPIWESSYLYDEGIENNKLTVELKQGKNTIEIKKVSGKVAFGDLYLAEEESLENYESYINSYDNAEKTKQTYFVQGEDFTFKNQRTINPVNVQNVNLTPYNLDIRLLNTLDGDSFAKHNGKVGYGIEVGEEGLYKIGFNYKSGLSRKNTPTFANIYVDGEIPFKEFKSFEFPYSKEYISFVTDQYIFLSKGTHIIEIEINQELMSKYNDRLKTMLDDIMDIGLEIKMLTGNKVDNNRSWTMEEYFPELEDKLEGFVTDLDEIIQDIDEINHHEETEESMQLALSRNQLKKILQNMDQMPNRMNLFSAGNNSVAGRLSIVVNNLKVTPLFVDMIYFTDDIASLPQNKAASITKVQDSMKRLFRSFEEEQDLTESREIEVWVRRGRQNLEVMQKMVDQQFTPKTGIKVKLSLLHDQSKLTMANAAGTNPDLVTGVDASYVSDLGQRGALENLKEYPNAKKIVGAVTPGAMLQMFIEDSIYGIPETQDFFLSFYRKDIMDKLGLGVPHTWEEVKDILPILQRHGMNYYLPLSAEGAFKGYPATAPFIYQNGAVIFEEGGLSTGIASEKGLESFELMTELFSINSMALPVASFYEDFREGTIPVGVNGFGEYIRMYYAAPEIFGKWSIALSPGIEVDGVIDRTVTGTSSALMMFKDSTKKEESWEFIEWWLKTETQVEYQDRLQNIFGPEYMFVPASLEAIKSLSIPKEHLEIILEQIGWVNEVPRIPGGYIAEREISNAWIKIVMDNENLRNAVDDAKTTIDRELRRKMEEFGYLKNGENIKPYKVHTIESVESWLEDD